MYLTADGSEVIMSDVVGDGSDTHEPRSIESDDVVKYGMIFTKTPNTLKKGDEGRERLLDFFNHIEANIAKEIESRKSDIASIRAQMAKNMALNADARKKMKAALTKTMAENAKTAKDNLNAAMEQTQKNFASFARAENKRHREDIKRFRATRKLMRANKKEARDNLHAATLAQQRALAALSQATNEKIHSTNQHIAANSAAMKLNAKKARDDLDNAMSAFDNKMANVMEEAKKGRSKLAAAAATQDKKFREYANNEVKRITAEASAEFAKVRETMAKDRAHADAELTHETARVDAALNARAALQDKRFASTVSDIKAAKEEADERVKKFTSGFKAGILKLANTAAEQQKKLNDRQSELAGVVTTNQLEQAKVNNEVDAELKRMLALGDTRYQEHLAKDEELKTLMKKNKEDNKGRMEKMALDFKNKVDEIQATMKKDRAHAENRLASKTTELYDVMKSNVEAQDKVNKELTDATHAAAMQAAADLRTARDDFTKRLGSLHTTVTENAKKVNKEILDLTGIEEANAIKSAAGRAQLRKVSEANKASVHEAVRDAIHKGEQHALAVEKKMAGVNDETKVSLNGRITAEIGALQKTIHSQISELTLETKEARAEMRAEIQAAIKDEATLAKENLKKTVEWSEGEFSALEAKLTAEEGKSEGERAALRTTIAGDKKKALDAIADAVAAQNKALLSLKQETEASIKETNKNLAAQADIMRDNAAAVGKQMDANAAAITASLEAARKAAQAQLASVSAASVTRYDNVVQAVKDGVAAAKAKADDKFTKLYEKMADERKKSAEDLAGAVSDFNDKLAKQSALEDSRFSKTVKDLAAAKAEAAAQVKSAREFMLASISEVTAHSKEVETRVSGDLQVVSGMVKSDKAAQLTVNRKVDDEMARILKLSDDNYSANKNARGAIKEVMDKNKETAARETKAVADAGEADLKLARSQQAAKLLAFKQDLSKATSALYGKLAKDEVDQNFAMDKLNSNLAESQAAAAESLKQSKELFASKLTTLTNAVTANQASFKEGLAKVTGLHADWEKDSEEDRAAVRKARDGMVADLHKNIVRAIEVGEARMKQVESTAMANIETEKKALLTTISESVENMADNVFALVQGNRQKIADNYLSLKAYSATAADKIEDYLAKGKGRNLSSIGDLLKTVAGLSDVKVTASTGEGMGSGHLTSIFSRKEVKVDDSVSKINGLVNEYVATVGQVKMRWPLGLGKYLISKLEVAMQGTGALEVDKVSDKAGNFVFINAHAVGLSSKLSDFQSLAVRMSAYEHNLAGQTSALPTTKTAAKITIGPPQWQGN
jgi:hypothetical protein